MSDGEPATSLDLAPWSSPCYLLATMELHGVAVSKKSSREEAHHCMVQAVMLLQDQRLTLDQTLRNIPDKVTQPPKEDGGCEMSPQDGATGRMSSVADGIISAIRGHGYKEGTLALGEGSVRVHEGERVVWELNPRHLTGVAALGADGGLVLLGGRPDARRAVALRLPTQADAKAFVVAYQASRKNKLPPKREQVLQQEVGASLPPIEQCPKSLDPRHTQDVSTENTTKSKRMERPSPPVIPKQKKSSNTDPPSQNSSPPPLGSYSGFPTQSPGEPQTPTSPPPEVPSSVPREFEGPLVSSPHFPENRESPKSQILTEPMTPTSPPPKPPVQRSSESPLSTEPLTPTSPPPRPPVQRSSESSFSTEPMTPTSPPPRPPVQRSDLSSKASASNTGGSKVTNSDLNNLGPVSSSTKHKSRLPSPGGRTMSSTEEEAVHDCDQSQNSISKGNNSILKSSGSSLAETKCLKHKTETKIPRVKERNTKNLKIVISDKFQSHSKQFLKDELAYCENLKELIALRDMVNDDCLSMSLTLLAKIMNTHVQIVNYIVRSEQTPCDFAKAFLDHQNELSSYVDLIRASTVLEVQNFEDPEGHIRMIVGKMQSIRLKPHHYALTLESWLEFVESEDKRNLEKAINSLKKISKKADAFLLVDAVKRCPYNLSFHFPLRRYGEYHVSGKGFQNQQKYTVLLMTDLIVFTMSSGTNSFDCVDAIRLEHVLIQESKEADTFVVDVNYGQRRGRESIVVKCSTNSDACNWRGEIVNMRLDYAKKIMRTQKNDLAVRAKTMISARDMDADRSGVYFKIRENHGTPNSGKVDLARRSSQFYVGT